MSEQKYKTYVEKYADFVSDEDDAERLVKLFEDFRQNELDEKKNQSGMLPFGKYKFEPINEVIKLKNGRGYLEWVVKQEKMGKDYPKLIAEINKLLQSSS